MRPVRALAFLVLLAACDRVATPTLDPNYREPMVNGTLYRVEYYDHSVEYFRDFEVADNAGFRMVPTVLLNGREVKPYHYSSTLYRYGDESWFRVYRPYSLEVAHYWGTAFSRVFMPGSFELTSPPEDYILDLDSTLLLAWRPSAGAQWYWLDFYADFDFLDSNGTWDDYSFDFDTVIHDTFLLLPPGRVFPGRVMDVIEGDGSVYVVAAYGPEVEPGDIGNVRGAGYGFFSAGNEPVEKYFYVGAPPFMRRSPGPPARRGRLLDLLLRRTTVDTASPRN